MGEVERIEERVGGRTLNDLFMQTAMDHGHRTALKHNVDGTWRTITWAEYRDRAAAVAMGLRSRGIDHGDFAALMMRNRPEHVISDVGAMLCGATPVSVYNTLAPEQIQHVAGDCGARVAIVDDRDYLEKWLQVRDGLPDLEHIFVLDPGQGDLPAGVGTFDELEAEGRERLATGTGEFENAWRAVDPQDPATIIYTSGTTGPPKGVVLTHHNLMFQLMSLNEVLDVEPGLRGISYLPLAHVAERMTTHYNGINNAGSVTFALEVADLLATLQEARPHTLMAVPRVWEKMYAGVMAQIDASDDERRKRIAHKAVAVAKEWGEAQFGSGSGPGLRLRLQHALFDRLVYSKMRAGLGLDECRYPISGAAPINLDLMAFFAGIGLPILEVYGMTESTAVITANRPGRIRLGTVGEPAPGIEVRIADDGEVLFRGPVRTPGYWQRPDANAAAIDEEGWFHTGDLGVMEDGYLRIIGRKKELIITSSGKNLSPNNIEETIKQQSPLIGQICAVGDDRPYISALVVLDEEALPVWAQRAGIGVVSVAELAQHPAVEAEVERAIQAGNQRLARIEQVKRWAILPTEWTAESEELTPTLKLKRSVIHTKYGDVIDGLYSTA